MRHAIQQASPKSPLIVRLQMTAATRRLVANVILGIALVVLVVQVCGMIGWIPKYVPTRQLSILVLILAIASGSLRRRGREAPETPRG
jgi:di/tricarboxylate transporter